MNHILRLFNFNGQYTGLVSFIFSIHLTAKLHYNILPTIGWLWTAVLVLVCCQFAKVIHINNIFIDNIEMSFQKRPWPASFLFLTFLDIQLTINKCNKRAILGLFLLYFCLLCTVYSKKMSFRKIAFGSDHSATTTVSLFYCLTYYTYYNLLHKIQHYIKAVIESHDCFYSWSLANGGPLLRLAELFKLIPVSTFCFSLNDSEEAMLLMTPSNCLGKKLLATQKMFLQN